MVLVTGKMFRPTDVAVNVPASAVYVVEHFNHRISKWNYNPGDFDFTLDGSWGSNGDGTSGEAGPIGDGGPNDNSLDHPTGIALATVLYVADTNHNRVRSLDIASGLWLNSFGKGGRGDEDFYHPTGIESDGDNIVVADELNHRAVLYDDNSGSFDFQKVIDDPATLGGTAKSFNRPHGVTFTSFDNSFYVTDTYHGVITQYDVAFNVEAQFGSPGTTGTNLFFPGSGCGILTGNSSGIFADTRNNILKTVADTTIANTTGTIPGVNDGDLYYPESTVAFVDTANYVLAANTLNNRIEIYANEGGDAVLTNKSPFNFGSPLP